MRQNTAFRSSVLGISCLAVAAPTSVLAAADLAVVSLSGDRGWTVECAFDRADDAPIVKRARGRGGVVRLSARDSTSGRCDYEAPADGVLRMRFENEAAPDACPWAATDGACVAVFRNGDAGAFDF
ncbi:MAG: hypothetical protein ACFB00_12210 [Parvularculaceae bacterium]